MNTRVIKALLRKDVSLFMSNRFYLLITIVSLVFVIGAYFVLPAAADEEMSLAVSSPVALPALEEMANGEGAAIDFLADEAALKQAVAEGDYQVGIALPEDVAETLAAGGRPEVTVYYGAASSPEINAAAELLVGELFSLQAGQSLNYEITEEVLGPDMLDARLAIRDRLRPMLAVLILLLEILTLASLIAVEIEQGTARALLVTPMRTSDLFIAKGVLGVGLALVQALLFMALVGGFSHQPLIILVALVVGSVMVVGIGFLLASLARDVMAVTGWGMLVLIILVIPGLGTVIPGLLSSWTMIIPSYYLTDTVSRVVNYGAGWGDVGWNLVILAAFTAVVIWGGMTALRRRYQ